MTHYVAFVEEEPDCAVGVWFPDLPGCYSAGDDIDEAMMNAREAIALWAEGEGTDAACAQHSRNTPRP